MGLIANKVKILIHPYMGTRSKTEPISFKLGILIKVNKKCPQAKSESDNVLYGFYSH